MIPIDIIPIGISSFALLLSVLRFPQLQFFRLFASLFAMGTGQIYMATAALCVTLLVDSKFRLTVRFRPESFSIISVLILSILIVTFLSPISLRTYSELFQLFLYIVVFVMIFNRLQSQEDFYRLLKAMSLAALCVALIGIGNATLGFASPPHIFLARGSNETSLFLCLTGVVSTVTLFAKDPKIRYLIFFAVLCYAQFLATSRSNVAISIMLLAVALFFLAKNQFVRFLIVVIFLGILVSYVPVISDMATGLINYSALERLALLEYGWTLWEQRPWTGWGWGSTSELAVASTFNENEYPHFHNTYIQFLVELGALGWVFVCLLVLFLFRNIFKYMIVVNDKGVSTFMVSSSIAILLTGLFSSLLFGADRAIQLLILFGLMGKVSIVLGEDRRRKRTKSASLFSYQPRYL